MGLVALTCAVAALGAHLGRDISRGFGIVAFIGAIACILGLNVAVFMLLLSLFGGGGRS